MADYTQDISIVQMVLDRLPIMENTEQNTDKIGRMIYEVMWELEPCFRIAGTGENRDVSRIGKEVNYDIGRRSVIADVVSVYILLILSALATGVQDSEGNVTGSTFLKSAKAGSVEVSWEQFSMKDSNLLSIGGAGLMEMYKKSAMRKARNYGCIIDICGDCSLAIEILNQSPAPPFIVVEHGCTSCGG